MIFLKTEGSHSLNPVLNYTLGMAEKKLEGKKKNAVHDPWIKNPETGGTSGLWEMNEWACATQVRKLAAYCKPPLCLLNYFSNSLGCCRANSMDVQLLYLTELTLGILANGPNGHGLWALQVLFQGFNIKFFLLQHSRIWGSACSFVSHNENTSYGWRGSLIN